VFQRVRPPACELPSPGTTRIQQRGGRQGLTITVALSTATKVGPAVALMLSWCKSPSSSTVSSGYIFYFYPSLVLSDKMQRISPPSSAGSGSSPKPSTVEQQQKAVSHYLSECRYGNKTRPAHQFDSCRHLDCYFAANQPFLTNVNATREAERISEQVKSMHLVLSESFY